jgi:hypothetical protein
MRSRKNSNSLTPGCATCPLKSTCPLKQFTKKEKHAYCFRSRLSPKENMVLPDPSQCLNPVDFGSMTNLYQVLKSAMLSKESRHKIENTNRMLACNSEKLQALLNTHLNSESSKPKRKGCKNFPITDYKSYEQVLQIAFDPPTENGLAKRATNALIRARARANRFQNEIEKMRFAFRERGRIDCF